MADRYGEIRVQQDGSWMEITRRVVNNSCVVMGGNLGATWIYTVGFFQARNRQA